jgi:rhodanese-related sulfurtransferase
MSAGQIILYGIAGLFLLIYVRKLILRMLITQYTPTKLAARIESGEVVLVDVREDKERSVSHIQGDIHIPIKALLKDSDRLNKYKHKEIVCYCQTGSRSLIAATRLKKLGFKVANLSGGMGEWNYYYR